MTVKEKNERPRDNPFPFRCPVCGGELLRNGSRWCCSRNHSFDIAKQGYVNLLMSNRSGTKRHGDDRAMVLARQSFLEQGYYNCLRDGICRAAGSFCGDTVCFADIGCGEGWYTAAVRQEFVRNGKACRACGIDISRTALIQAAKRDRGIFFAVGSVRTLPLQSESLDLLLSIFAPKNDGEFGRVLKRNGILICAEPAEEHLLGLKTAVYEKPYRNPRPEYEPEGFTLLRRDEIRERICLRNREDIRNLFMMTPYYYKTGRADQEKLNTLGELETDIGFTLFIFRRD